MMPTYPLGYVRPKQRGNGRLHGWPVLILDLFDKALHLTNERSCLPPRR